MSIRATNIGEHQGITLPTFGDVLRRLRDQRGLSRERLAFSAGVSASYVTQLEKGGKAKPTQAVVDALVRCMNQRNPLSDTERRYLYDLAGLTGSGYPTVAELKRSIGADALRVLAMHRPKLAAFYDTRGNVLAGNIEWAQAFPGLAENGNLYRWMFADPAARQVMADWEADARKSVSWLRGSVGSLTDPTVFGDLMRELGEFAEFRRFWSTGDVGFAPPVRTMRLRDRGTGELKLYRIQVGMLESVAHPGLIVATVGLPTGSAS
ncbi:helix-turn-helix domain-containing protein [Nocardia sp. NPDC005746]|uniref:MmyB family transcriptional regulator n=1 Tax=Nocardia sp. NPDC005746 TaxID=3157062 RepID=UPI00340AF2E4